MEVKEDIGDSIAATGAASYVYSKSLTTSFGYTYESKIQDDYTGIPNGRDTYLEEGTLRYAHIAKVEVTYSTVNDYLEKKIAVPGALNWEISRVFSGRNIENQTRYEATLSLYF
jgi:hypothetical protein